MKYQIATHGFYAVLAILTLGRQLVIASETIPGEPNIAWVKSLFSILPDTTETVVVMGPYQYEPPASPKPIGFRNGAPLYGPNASASTSDIAESVFHGNMGYFECHPVLKQFVDSQPIALSVWGFRPVTFKVEFPGGTWAESCQLLVPENEIPDTVASLFRTARKRIAGHAVVEGNIYDRSIQPQIKKSDASGGPQVVAPQGYQPPEKEDPQGHLFFAMPTKRLLIATNSETQLTSVLEALSKPAGDRVGFAYPADLPGKPSIWGLRRFGAQYTQAGPTATTRADYLMCVVDPVAGRLDFRLKTSDARAPAELSAAWRDLGGDELQWRPADPGLVAGSLSAADGGIWLGVVAVLGVIVLL